MGQSSDGRRQQGLSHPPRQSGSGATSVKRQQAAEDVQRADETEMNSSSSSRRSDDALADEDIERAGLRRQKGLEDDSDGEAR